MQSAAEGHWGDVRESNSPILRPQRSPFTSWVTSPCSRAGRIWTADLVGPGHALYQAKLLLGARGRSRTATMRIFNPPFFLLDYPDSALPARIELAPSG